MKRRVLTLAVAGALIAGACGDDGDDAVTEETTAATTEESAAPSDDTADDPADDAAADDDAGADDGGAGADDDAADDAGEDTADDPGDDDPTVHLVPDEFATIQEAVSAAAPGDLVLISPGTYHEAVDVEVDDLTIRGLDRNTVVLDGLEELDNGIRVLGASGVAVENLTLTNYAFNGLFWLGSTGYRASYVTTYRTGDYGIYAFDSVQGLIEHSTTIGSRDGGVYIGQCYPCDAVVRHVVSSHNGLGYSGTNAGGNLYIVESDWHNNRVGIVPNSGTYELCYPQRDTVIVGNRVWDNNQADTAAIGVALLAQGNGILVAGGIGNTIERNRVDGHNRTGIGLVPYLEETPVDEIPPEEEWDLTCEESRNAEFTVPDGAILWDSIDNRVIDNVVTDSGEADIASATAEGTASELRNCISGNEAATTAPTALADLAPCDGEGSTDDWAEGDLGVIRWLGEQSSLPPEVDWRDAPLPEIPAGEQMPDAATAPARPATDVPPQIDVDAIETPSLDDD